MSDLKQSVSQKILKIMTNDDVFLEWLIKIMNSILSIDPDERYLDGQLEKMEQRVNQRLGGSQEEGNTGIPGFKNKLIAMLREEQFLAFGRVLKMLQDIFLYSDERIINYLKKLKFQVIVNEGPSSPWVNIRETSTAIMEGLDPARINIFKQLSYTQRSQLRGFTWEQLDLISHLSPTAVDILSRLTHLPPQHRILIINLPKDESRLFSDLGLFRIRFLSQLPISERKEFLELCVNRDTEGVSRFLKSHGLDDQQPSEFQPEQSTALEETFGGDTAVLGLLSEEGINLAGRIHELSEEERNYYLELDPTQFRELNNLSEDQRNVIMEFQDGDPSLANVLNVANGLTLEQRDLILSVTQEQLEVMVADGNGPTLSRVRDISLNNPGILGRFSVLTPDEEKAILQLTKEEKSTLSKAFDLGHDGLFMMDKLGSTLTEQVFNSHSKPGTNDGKLSALQKALIKKLANLKEPINFSEFELTRFFEIMRYDSRDTLLSLSWGGIESLRRLIDSDSSTIDNVLKLSDSGLRILNMNDRLTGEQLLALTSLDESEGRVLINLNLDQRDYLSHGFTRLDSTLLSENERQILRNFIGPRESVLSQITSLSAREINWLECRRKDRNFLASKDMKELNLFAILDTAEISLLSSFMNWNIEEDTVFTLLSMEVRASPNERYSQIDQYLQRISTPMRKNHIMSKLIANTIEIIRLTGVVTDRDIENISMLIERNCGNVHALIFKLQLLNVSLRGSKSLESLLVPLIRSSGGGVTLLGLLNGINTIEDVMFMRWLMAQPVDLNGGIFHDIVEITLSFPEDISGRALQLMLSESTSERDGIPRDRISATFRNMLRARRYSIAALFLFGTGLEQTLSESSGSMMTTLAEILTPEDCFQLLNTPIAEYNEIIPWIENPGHSSIFTDERFRNPNVFATSLYYGRGDQYPLLEMLNENQKWELLQEGPLLLLKLMVGRCRDDLLGLYENVENVNQLIERNRQTFIRDLTHTLAHYQGNIPIEACFRMANTIRYLGNVSSFAPRDEYIQMVSDYVVNLRTRVSREVLSDIINYFVTNEVVGRMDLIDSLKNRIERDLYSFLIGHISGRCLNGRSNRDTETESIICMDSRNTEEITSVEEIDALKSENVELYDELVKYYNGGRDVRVLISKMKNIPLDNLDPRIKPVVTEIRNNIKNEKKIITILNQSGIASKINKMANAAGLGFTVFLVGKDLINGDLGSLGNDALNFWVMPKIGEKVTTLLTDFAERNNLAMTGKLAPVLGATIGNMAAVFGLVEGIQTLRNAVDPVDMKLADLNIVTNSIFIAANIPILSSFGVEFSLMGGLAGPLGLALSVGVMVVSYLTSAGFQVEKVGEHIRLTSSEEKTLYGRFLLGKSIPEYLQIDVTAKNMYTQYFNDYLKHFKGEYDEIAISLPHFVITKRECVKNTGQIRFGIGCNLGEKNTSYAMGFHEKAYARTPFNTHQNHKSRILSDGHEGYDIVCGPSTDDAKEQKINPDSPDFIPIHAAYHDTKWDVEMEELFLPPTPNDDCINIVAFKKRGSSNSTKMLFDVTQDASIAVLDSDSIDMIFWGRIISITDSPSTVNMHSIPENRYYLQTSLHECRVHRKGYNFFYLSDGKLNCDLGNRSRNQHNIVVVRKDFDDSEGIHSIVGSDDGQQIRAHFAEYIDGKGGGDIIEATERTLVKGYFYDFIIGESPVLLPLNVSDIGHLRITTCMTIYNKTGAWIEVDGNTPVITADNYLLTPIRYSNITHKAIHAHIRKTLEREIILENELFAMREIKIPNCTLVKQLSSVNYDIILSDVGRNIFYADKTHHAYYWESSGEDSNTYIFGKLFANITVSKANGILNFQSFMLKIEQVIQHLFPKQDDGIFIPIGGLHVNLLPNYKNLTYTFDGKEYYKLQNKIIVRDWCPQGILVVGRMVVNGTEMGKHPTCFEFDSKTVLFLKLVDDLLLVSGVQLLIILKYYSTIHEGRKLSLKLKDRMIEPQIFQDSANNPHKMIYYKANISRLKIYHNQPVDKRHIGLVDSRDRSIKDIEMIIKDRNLLLLFRNESIVKIEDWKYYQPSRRIMFVFKDSFLPNAGCIMSHCKANDIIGEFQIDQIRVENSRPKRSAQPDEFFTSSASCKFSWINDLINAFIKPFQKPSRAVTNYSHPRRTFNDQYLNQFGYEFSIISNINLTLVLLQQFLGKIYPLPKPQVTRSIDHLVDVINLTEEYERIVNNTARRYHMELRGLNFFKLYSDIVKLVKAEVSHDIPKVMYSAAGEIYPRHREFLIDLKINIQQMFISYLTTEPCSNVLSDYHIR